MKLWLVSLVIWLGMMNILHAQSPRLPSDATFIAQAYCSDTETKQKGFCQLYISASGMWSTFTQKGKVRFIRNTPKPGDKYNQVWTDPTFNQDDKI